METHRGGQLAQQLSSSLVARRDELTGGSTVHGERRISILQEPVAIWGYQERPMLAGSYEVKNRDLPRSASLKEYAAELEPRVSAFISICKRWTIKYDDLPILLGYAGDRSFADCILRGTIRVSSQDIADRISYIIATSLILGAIFADDPNSEATWISTPRAVFSGKSAKDVLREGHLIGIWQILNLARSEGELVSSKA